MQVVSSITALEGANNYSDSESNTSKPVLGRRPAWLKNRRRARRHVCIYVYDRANTENPSAVSSMQYVQRNSFR
jgi:hypothetical protein